MVSSSARPVPSFGGGGVGSFKGRLGSRKGRSGITQRTVRDRPKDGLGSCKGRAATVFYGAGESGFQGPWLRKPSVACSPCPLRDPTRVLRVIPPRALARSHPCPCVIPIKSH